MTNASSSKMSIEDMIGHYQRSIERSQHDPNRILHCIGKLSRMHITVQHLTSTGIGRTVNALRKDDGAIGKAAKELISKWKQMVASQESDGEGEGDGNGNGHADDDDNAEGDEEEPQNNYNYERENKIQTESIGNSERKSHKTHAHLPKSGTSNNNNHHHHHHHHHQQQQEQEMSNHHHHHRDQNHRHAHGKTSDSHSVNRKLSSDDTDEQSMHSTTHSKHKHKSHSRDDDSGASRKREHESNQEINGSKNSSKHSKSERHHHRSRHDDDQLNSDETSDKKRKHENKDRHSSKHSNHHKSHSDGNEKTDKSHNKHKRERESDDVEVSPKKLKKDSSHSSSSRSEEKKSSKSKHQNVSKEDGFEIDHSMGTSFADALGMLQPIRTSSKSDKVSIAASSSKSSGKSFTVTGSPSTSSKATATSSSSSSSSHSKNKSKHKSKASTSSTSAATLPPPLLLEKPKLPPLEDIAKDLPPPSECIIPNDYKPTPINPMILECVFKGPKSQANIPMLSETAALCASTTSKNQRTKVYSGVKSGQLLTVPSLHELCIRFLQKNIDALEYTGGVPFEILKPVLERASPEQLEQFEFYNPYLMEDSDILWQQHCQRKFKACKRQEMETWREMYERCKQEQEARLNSLTRNIKESQSIAVPVRQTKLAYVDSLVKPPRNVVKKQNQFGTHHKLTVTPAARVEALSSVSSNMARSGDARLKALAALRDTAQAVAPAPNGMKPKKAPLMTKALQLMKGRFKR